MQARHGYERPPRVGAAGGISTPVVGGRRLAMGAAYVVTGSVNQSCVEAGTSDAVRRMLAQAQQADIAMAPAADMFEMGVKVQVLKRGTLFAMRATKLYELYRATKASTSLPDSRTSQHRKDHLPRPARDDLAADEGLFSSSAIRRGSSAPSAIPSRRWPWCFRWYLGMSSHWANQGDPSRTVDYQIWCGPAMAAFNDWVRGIVSRAARESPRGDRRAQYPLRRGRPHPRPDREHARASPYRAGVPRLSPLEVDEIENRLFFS